MNFARWFGTNVFRPPWMREHERIRCVTQFALDRAEAERMRVAVALNTLRLEIRRRQTAPPAE